MKKFRNVILIKFIIQNYALYCYYLVIKFKKKFTPNTILEVINSKLRLELNKFEKNNSHLI